MTIVRWLLAFVDSVYVAQGQGKHYMFACKCIAITYFRLILVSSRILLQVPLPTGSFRF